MISLKGSEFSHNKPGPLAFVHIPKCSGTAFENYLLGFTVFSNDCRCFTGINLEGEKETLVEYAKNNRAKPFVYGHIPYEAYKNYFNDCVIVSFLRDPVSRVVSNYKSWHDPANFTTKDPHYRAATIEVREAIEFSKKCTLAEFIETDNDYIKKTALQNIQVVMLSSASNVSHDLQLQSAKKNIENLSFFGLTERFTESISLFRSTFSDAPEYRLGVTSENRSRTGVNVTEDAVEKIRALVAFDTELHAYANELFEKRLQIAGNGNMPMFKLRQFVL